MAGTVARQLREKPTVSLLSLLAIGDRTYLLQVLIHAAEVVLRICPVLGDVEKILLSCILPDDLLRLRLELDRREGSGLASVVFQPPSDDLLLLSSEEVSSIDASQVDHEHKDVTDLGNVLLLKRVVLQQADLLHCQILMPCLLVLYLEVVVRIRNEHLLASFRIVEHSLDVAMVDGPCVDFRRCFGHECVKLLHPFHGHPVECQIVEIVSRRVAERLESVEGIFPDADGAGLVELAHLLHEHWKE